ncbi:MAG TPA: UvrD-helicase domain-containing protein [candidate division Zixibacteria bacterium]
MAKILEELNPPQKEAVLHTEGPLLVLAGAGSGKTRVLTYRIAYLVGEKKVNPYNILAITFTNKAAREMKSRVDMLLGRGSDFLWVSTFHSLCSRILRKECQVLEYKKHFSIYDEADQISLIKKCEEELGIPIKEFSPAAVLNRISQAKNNLIGWQDFASIAQNHFEQKVSKIYPLYQKKLKENDAFDFDDLIMKTVEIFENHPQVLENYQDRFKYILVDEYQDTNHAQYALIKHLSSKYKNLCVVGDDDQSIYAWRGADLNNILDFEKDFPDTKVVRLEQNYRSTQIILDAAISVVKNNVSRKGKVLWTEKKGGEKLVVSYLEDDRMEAKGVVQRMDHLVANFGYGRSDFVVLYRTNAQSRIIEQELRDKGIPYTIVGGVKFYERKEVKDVLAYLRVLVNADDQLSLKRIINVPHRGIGQKTMARIEEEAFKKRKNLLETLKHIRDVQGISDRMKKEINSFANLLNELNQLKKSLKVDQLTEEVIQRSGYLDRLKEERTIEAQTRAENVEELVAATKEFVERVENPSVESFMEEVSLLTDIDQWDDTQDVITLMTLHAAKGLEFPAVFITGLEEGLFPLSRSLEKQEDLEEERRLFHVGLTRAKERIFLSYVNFRRRFEGMLNLPSRFIDEIPEELYDFEDLCHRGQHKFYPNIKREYEDWEIADDILKVGTWVLHSNWGKGRIIEKQGYGEDSKLTVLFSYGVKKKLLAKYANLEILQK